MKEDMVQMPSAENYAAIIEVYEKALDDIVSVNSLFTLAVFVGLAFASPDKRSLDNRPHCSAGSDLAKELILFEVLSFACFLLSSLSATSLKVLVNLDKIKERIRYKLRLNELTREILLSVTWIRVLLGLAMAASFIGIFFLVLSMIHVIQITVGELSCGSEYAFKSVASLCGIVGLALILYAPSIVFAVAANARNVEEGLGNVEITVTEDEIQQSFAQYLATPVVWVSSRLWHVLSKCIRFRLFRFFKFF